MNWGTFEVIYDKETGKFNPEHHKNLIEYVKLYPDSLNHNIWLDPESKSYFSSAQYISTKACGQNHSFITSPNSFLTNQFPNTSHWVKSHFDTLRSAFHDLPEVITPEFRCGYNNVVKSIHNQDSVFVVGGGPSTGKVDFSSYTDTPKWIMNNFYKNEKLKNLENIQLVTFLDDVDLEDDKLLNFMSSRKPSLLQEITDKGSNRLGKVKEISTDSTYLMTRYRSRIGIGARLVIFAILMGIENIYISGLDGYAINAEETHVFEANKDLPRWITGYNNGGITLQSQQFVVFWDYIFNNLSKKYNFKIHDLSKGCDTVQYKFIQDILL